VALGSDGVATIEQVMAKSTGTTAEQAPLHMRLSLGQVMDIVAKQGGNPFVGLAAQMLQGGQDHVHLFEQPIANGVQYRLEIEEGILKLIGGAAKMAMGGAGNL